jgi:chromosome segregation ATPase
MSMSAAVINLPTSAPACPQLQVLGGADANRTFPLSRTIFMVGRLPCCELKLKHPSVALIHCIFLHTPEGLVIRDCNTETGTAVNGVLVMEQVLKEKDVLKIGPFSFHVLIPEGWPVATTPTTSPRSEMAKPSGDGATGEGWKQLREERRKTQAFVDEQLASIRTAREALQAEEQAVEERLQAREVELQAKQNEIAAHLVELEERENRLGESQKAWAQDKAKREEEEQSWQTRQKEFESSVLKKQLEITTLEENYNHARDTLAQLRAEQAQFFAEKDELAAWLEEHRGERDRLQQEKETLTREAARLAEEATRLQKETQALESQRAEHQTAVQALADKERALEAARAEFEQEKAAFAERILNLETQEQSLADRQAELTKAEAEWESKRESAAQELNTWVEEQRRTFADEVEAERKARFKDIDALEKETLTSLLEWLMQTENFLANSLDAARESRAELTVKRSRLVRNDRKVEG